MKAWSPLVWVKLNEAMDSVSNTWPPTRASQDDHPGQGRRVDPGPGHPPQEPCGGGDGQDPVRGLDALPRVPRVILSRPGKQPDGHPEDEEQDEAQLHRVGVGNR